MSACKDKRQQQRLTAAALGLLQRLPPKETAEKLLAAYLLCAVRRTWKRISIPSWPSLLSWTAVVCMGVACIPVLARGKERTSGRPSSCLVTWCDESRSHSNPCLPTRLHSLAGLDISKHCLECNSRLCCLVFASWWVEKRRLGAVLFCGACSVQRVMF